MDPETAQVTAVSDPLPRILEGVPLRIRSVQVDLNRPNFTLNPTSCEPSQVRGTIAGSEGGVVTPVTHFQVGNCGALEYEPKLKLRVSGGMARRGHPAVHAVLDAGPGEANTKRVSVTLPPGELLDNSHIGTVCTRSQFAARSCPAGSELGTAQAKTPLLDNPLKGNVYLRSGPNKLPDLAIDLRGQIDVVLVGKIDTGKGGALRTTFSTVPDAPVEEFRLDLAGGKKGLLQNSSPICGRNLRVSVKMVGHNGARHNTNPALENSCGKARKKKAKRKAAPVRAARRALLALSTLAVIAAAAAPSAMADPSLPFVLTGSFDGSATPDGSFETTSIAVNHATGNILALRQSALRRGPGRRNRQTGQLLRARANPSSR